jgi:hypothetical protein
VCVISSPERAPMFGVLPDVLGRFVPEQREIFFTYHSHLPIRTAWSTCSQERASVRFAWNECDAKIRLAASTNIGIRLKPDR